MFCPTCGKTVNGKLKYCNSCGERLAKEVVRDKDSTPGKMLDGILETLFWFAMVGLGILIGLVAVLMKQEFPPNLVAIIVVAYLSTIFGICFLLARQVPKLIDARLKAWERGDETTTQQLKSPTTAQLEEYREPLSVTDHTTRTLDKVPAAGK